ncbi:MAG: acyltransferase [Oscillospiraceae bacterium]|jgi:serine/alanine racemase|nr:acyltransferase [Oscillospiraceae bacterium]
MKKLHKFMGIDTFRFFCALVVVGIHTYPLSYINQELNFVIFHIFARIAVPFFLMATGYFVIPKYIYNKEKKVKFPVGFFKKTILIYSIATILYLPVSIYAGYFSSGNIVVNILRNLMFDGVFYHLWYLPASIIGMVIIYLLARVLNIKMVLGLSIILYIFGLLGDSYYGVIKDMPVINTLYNAGFQFFSYTRNGIFFAPVFLILGAWIANVKVNKNLVFNIIGFTLSMLFMLTEGVLLHLSETARHDSMYIFLLPCMYFMFNVLLQCRGGVRPILREVSMYIYIMHPILIVIIRGVVRIMGFGDLFVSNNIIHFITVSLLSILLSTVIIKAYEAVKPDIRI